MALIGKVKDARPVPEMVRHAGVLEPSKTADVGFTVGAALAHEQRRGQRG